MPEHTRPSVEKNVARLTAGERMTLSRAVFAHANYPPAKGTFDLSSVRNPVERAVEDILAARVTPPAEQDTGAREGARPNAEFDVAVTFTVRVSADTLADAQADVGDRIRSEFFDGEDRGAITAMASTRVQPPGTGGTDA